MNCHLILCDIKEDLCKEWDAQIKQRLAPEEQSHFTVLPHSFQQYKGTFDCIVSPANSYARLDGSFDALISNMFCPPNPDAVTDYCQEYIHGIFNGYQVPGTCYMIPMSAFNEKRFNCKWIAHCPTMRVPMNCRWNKDIVYNCMWSLLNELRTHNTSKPQGQHIRTVLVTGLGTGIGRFPADTCASQMIVAYRHFVDNLRKTSHTTSWDEAIAKGLDLDETVRTVPFLSPSNYRERDLERSDQQYLKLKGTLQDR